MNPYIAYPICSCFYSILLMVIFFSKKRMKTEENSIFLFVLIFNFFALIGELLCYIGVDIYDQNRFLSLLILKTYVVLLLIWILIYNVYNMLITNKNHGEKSFDSIKYVSRITKYTYLTAFILSIVIYIIPLYMYNDGIIKYTYGPGVYLLTGVMVILIFIWIIRFFINYKNIKNKKNVPLIAFFILITIAVILQSNNRGMLLITSVETFICILMYFTIENPDVKMLNEVYKNKELMEQTYEDKSNFLFEMTQEVREPLNEMRQICNEIKEDKQIRDIKDKINLLNNSIRQLDFTVNDVLNISTLDVQRVKLIDNRYSLKGLYDDIISRVNVNNGVEFRTSIPNNLPYLYGDNIKLKQVIYSILMNSVSKTNEGFIEFNIDIIEKYDVARVIFTIRDSGIGMSIDKINDVLSTTSEFDSNDLSMLEKTEFNVKLCQKIVKAMGGNLLIKSKIGKGTEVILTIDQRKYIKDNNETIINSYEEKINNKKVLIISQDKNLVENIKDEFNKKDINYSHILYGKDALDKIKSGKKYDFIIVEDDMKEISGYETLKLLKEEKDFNTPVVILLNKDKENIKDHFMKDGFSDYILISDLRNEISRIIDKY